MPENELAELPKTITKNWNLSSVPEFSMVDQPQWKHKFYAYLK